MTRIDDILLSLIKRTEEKKLKWRTSVDSQVFISAVDTIGIVVRRIGRRNYPVNEEPHQLEILNDEGLTVEVLETGDDFGPVPPERLATGEQTKNLSCLYTLARSSALESDLTLEKLARNLERL